MSPTNDPARQLRSVTDSPLGPLTLVAAGGALAGLYMNGRAPQWVADAIDAPEAAAAAEQAAAAKEASLARTPDEGQDEDQANAAVLAAAARQLAEYFAGERRSFDLPLALAGTEFQRRVWAALRDIPYGETISYAELARRIGQPTAMRAVGLANGRNPVSIVVPCHRVIGASGSLTGYGGGLASKAKLIELEWRVIQDVYG